MKRTISLALALTLAALTVCSCGGGAAAPTDTTASGEDTAETTESMAQILGFDKEDNGGKEFTIYASLNKAYEYDAPELTGDVVSDAVYYKNTAVEDYLGIRFNFIYEDNEWPARETFNGKITQDIMSGDRVYDLVNGITVCTTPIIGEGYFLDGKQLPNVQFDKPWWIADMYDRFSVGGKLFGFIGDGALSLYKDMTVIFFNKRIWDEYKAPNPYELVRNDEWLLDKFIEVCSTMAVDLNGDGTFKPEDDQYTYIAEAVPNGTFQTALQLEVVRIEKDGTPTYLGLTEKFASAFERLQAFNKLDGVKGNFNSIDTKTYESMKTFANCNIATMTNFIYSTEYLRDMKDDYGIIPLPKYDEYQEKYIAQLGTSTTMMFVPITTKDVTLTSKVMEALAYYGHEMVVPKYYEVALKEKYARDTDMMEMLDIIREGASFDFLYVYGTTLTSAPNSSFRFYNTSDNIASIFASNETKFTASLADLIDKVSKIEQ